METDPGGGFEAWLRSRVEARRRAQLIRVRRVLAGPQRPCANVDGRPMVTFCSNDYLGLAADPRVARALRTAAGRAGVGSGASHLVVGHGREHAALEEEIADFLGTPRALLFSCGYMANLGVVTALAGRGDRVVEDRLNHASLIDAGRLSGASVKRYRHGDVQAARRRLQASGAGLDLLVTDGVFSMDGDLAPLTELAALAREVAAVLVVDDAHGFGVLGASGRGSIEQLGLRPDQVPVRVGTLGKALGTFGAFVAGSEALIEHLIQTARSYIYTTALPPSLAAATRRALAIVRAEPWRRQLLAERIRRFRAGAAALGLPLLQSSSPIQPLVIGKPGATVRIARALESDGILVTPIRPPTVPDQTSRLRITLSTAHTEGQVDRLLAALAKALAEQPVPGAAA